MYTQPIPVVNTFATPRVSAGANTAYAGLVPPSPGPPGQAPFRYRVDASDGTANWVKPGLGIARITSIYCTMGTTAQTYYVTRPLNWTYFPAGLAKNTTVIPDSALTGIAADPGLYSTSYKYPAQGGLLTGVADAAISSTNKYVCYQLADGTWQLDTVASGTFGSTLTLTTGTPNTTGGAILAGAPLFYFGPGDGSLSDPATGVTNGFGFDTIVSVANTVQERLNGVIAGLHFGDPLLFFNANATAASSMSAVGYYGRW